MGMAKGTEGGARSEAKESLNIGGLRQVAQALAEFVKISKNLVVNMSFMDH